MKLTDEIKQKIDNYYNNISSEDLYNLSVNKYGFVEIGSIIIENQSFEISNIETYVSTLCNSYDNKDNTSYALAA
jgi:hypothetical protein